MRSAARVPGGHWLVLLKRSPCEIVYDAVEQEPLFELHHALPNQSFPVGRGVQPALKRFYSDAEAAMK
ncbi:hypothetical protein KDA_48200 [Dictyobacter alpinus]|uniref:Uncharacterized protein n=1 Tax=Dictyobacter alpinus TaxID=2014873 RepID=A0A402BDE4_9CHLR|nr:hypothetical protein [Dictyobacter alpinus]GCE29336.1 hypothetical protein KDA_48200 [Dictyobacter alpinus]